MSAPSHGRSPATACTMAAEMATGEAAAVLALVQVSKRLLAPSVQVPQQVIPYHGLDGESISRGWARSQLFLLYASITASGGRVITARSGRGCPSVGAS